MKMYTQYINNYSHALRTLASCKGRRPFRSWLDQTTRQTGKGLCGLLFLYC